MNYVSVCSGIEAATVAWHPLGWTPLQFAEISKFPSRVLAHHYPTVPNVGDFTKAPPVSNCDLLVGGTPCQAFSIVAGLRGGLSDSRGNLALEFMRLADRLRPRWLLWENVPGVLSSNGGRDFGSILGALGELGFGFAYRVLDAQFFGVPQRRRRVFVVGYRGDWRRAAGVLFERSSMRRDTPKSRKTRDQVAGTLGAGAAGGFGGDLGTGRGTPVVAWSQNSRDELRVSGVAPALTTGGGKPGQGYPAIAFHMTQDPISGARSPALSARGSIGVANDYRVRKLTPRECEQSVALRGRDGGATAELGGPVAHALRAAGGGGSAPYALAFPEPSTVRSTGGGKPGQGYAAKGGDPTTDNYTVQAMRVRKLTPRECERLQGFPDDYTLIEGAKDTPRYHALGNSMAVPVMRWLGERIAFVDALE